MSTPKTPMERAEELYEFTTNESGQLISDDCIHAYLRGDADRERIMREEASRGFIKCTIIKPNGLEHPTVVAIDYGERKIPFGEMIDMVEVGAVIAARADRKELVACILEMAALSEEAIRFSGYPARVEKLKSPLINYAALIKKLKAESGQ